MKLSFKKLKKYIVNPRKPFYNKTKSLHHGASLHVGRTVREQIYFRRYSMLVVLNVKNIETRQKEEIAGMRRYYCSYWVVGKASLKKVIFKQKPKRSQGASHAHISEQSVPEI